MKRYGYLYEKMYDMDNITLAHKNAKRGKAHYREVQMVDKEPDKYFKQIHKMLKHKTFRNSPYKRIIRNDTGKRREIYKLPYFPDRIIHHCIMNIIEPIWKKSLIHDTWSSIKNRGIHKGVRRIKKALQDRNGTQYCLKMDVKKFYPSIDNNVLKTIIRKKIKDPDALWILDEIIDSADGVPIGNYLSQYFGNLYLSPLDHWVKEHLRMKYYYRYCDDMVILLNSKTELHRIRREIEAYMQDELNLQMKDNWQVFPVDARGIDFLGYRFFHGYTLIRKSIVNSFKRKVKIDAPRESIESYKGWFKWGNTHNLTTKYLTA